MRRANLFDPAGSLRGLYETTDWSATPLGPVSSWSQALVGAVDLVLHTRFPVTLMWGAEFALVYNEAYVPLIADKHPVALGAPARDIFPEAWGTIGPLMRGVMAGEGAAYFEDLKLPLRRQGFLEECYFTFSYSAVRSEDGTIEGVVDIATETTRQVLDRRRLALLGQLGEALADLEHVDDVRDSALPVLAAAVDDLPLVDLRVGGSPPDPRLPARPGVGYGASRGMLLEETAAGRVAWLPLAGAEAPAPRPLLVVRLSEMLPPDEAYLGFLRLLATSLAQALDRIAVREAERSAAAAERGLSEALQRSLLGTPVTPEDLGVAVRYLPATEELHVGGDWHDAFVLEDGTLTLVVGDVAGHDRKAAVGMAQLRNLLRGVAWTLDATPSRLLVGLERAMRDVADVAFATAVVAQVEHDGDHGADDGDGDGDRGAGRRRRLRWSNAGHPPPILLAPDGSTRVLDGRPDPVLGMAQDGVRGEHTTGLPEGSAVLFYSDGLIERRGTSLDHGIDWLTRTLAGRQALTPDELCDHVVAQLGAVVEDDVALLVLKAGAS